MPSGKLDMSLSRFHKLYDEGVLPVLATAIKELAWRDLLFLLLKLGRQRLQPHWRELLLGVGLSKVLGVRYGIS